MANTQISTEAATIEVAAIEELVEDLYKQRFPAALLSRRAAVWKVLCRDWLDAYIPEPRRVLEIGAGYCEFINNVRASKRIAIDLNPDAARHARAGVEVMQTNAEKLSELVPAGSCDAVFMSNFLEHCRSREQLLAVLRGGAHALRPGGNMLILGPNFKYCYHAYYDYFDHHLALTENSVAEALTLAGLIPQVVMPRTLPFSFRSSLPSWPWLVRLYLHVPLVWRVFGAQFFLVAVKPAGPP
jgi:hypothetical protein